MRLLRDSTLFIWLLIIVGLLGVLGVSKVVGEDKSMPVPGDNSKAAVVSAKASTARSAVEDLRGLAPYGISAGQDQSAVSSWAEQMAAAAASGRAQRTAEGATEGDQFLAVFDTITQHAHHLQQVSGDKVRVQALRTRILLLVDRAHYLARGLPVPDALPDVATNLFGSATDLVQPTPGARPKPTAVPPIKPSPTPSLDMSKPTPGDLK